jgi:uncharacterized protein YqjF (DUF2071 family)
MQLATSLAMSFLTAEWRDLVMLNWEVAPELLATLVPRGTDLDTWQGHSYISLVRFRFLNARVLKIPVPFHVNFEEVNLRFYVRRPCEGETRRGVVFIKEFVPRACIALVARRWYNENYVAVPMSHRIERRVGQLSVRYAWTTRHSTHSLALQSDGVFREIMADSAEEFITEHYWGYCRQHAGIPRRASPLAGRRRHRIHFDLGSRFAIRPGIGQTTPGAPHVDFPGQRIARLRPLRPAAVGVACGQVANKCEQSVPLERRQIVDAHAAR